MNSKRSLPSYLATMTVIAIIAGLSVATAQGATLQKEGNLATGITDLTIGSDTYNVEFTCNVSTFDTYDVPPIFDFNDLTSAEGALDAILGVFNADEGVESVGCGTAQGEFNIAFQIAHGLEEIEINLPGTGILDVPVLKVCEGVRGSSDPALWVNLSDGTGECDFAIFGENAVVARFTLVGEPPDTAIAASSLPSSRSVQVGTLASAFATMINTGSTALTDCSIAPRTSVAADFAYQTTDAANVPEGTPNTPVDIPLGGFQNYIFGFVPSEPISPTQVVLDYDCTNSDPAPVTEGLNTLLLSATTTAVADIVALAITPTGDGILNLPGSNGSSAFSVATVNNGGTDTITATPETTVSLPVALSICETDPNDGTCLSAVASSTTSTVNAGFTPTYSVFATATGTVPFDPALNRIVVTFTDASGAVRGSTSVAVRTTQ